MIPEEVSDFDRILHRLDGEVLARAVDQVAEELIESWDYRFPDNIGAEAELAHALFGLATRVRRVLGSDGAGGGQ